MTSYAALTGRISQQKEDLETVVSRAESLMEKARRTGDDGYLDGVALNLHSFYTGVESIFEDIARNLDGEIPKGSDWHKQLLLQMSAEIPEIRPKVIQRKSRHCLEEYRGFRHVVRNVYTFNLRASRIGELADELRACFESVFSDLDEFGRFLMSLNREEKSV